MNSPIIIHPLVEESNRLSTVLGIMYVPKIARCLETKMRNSIKPKETALGVPYYIVCISTFSMSVLIQWLLCNF